MDAAEANQIWNYIGRLEVSRETARDLYQEAEAAIWEAARDRMTHENHSYLVKTGIGAIQHWLRDRYSLVRIPGYLQDRGEAAKHHKQIVPLEDMDEALGERFEDTVLGRLEVARQRRRVLALLPRLTKAEQEVMEALLAGRSIQDLASERNVRKGCVYAQRSRSIWKLRKLLAEEERGTLPPIIERIEQAKTIVLAIGQRNGNSDGQPVEWKVLLFEVMTQLGVSAETARTCLHNLRERYPGLVSIKRRHRLPTICLIGSDTLREPTAEKIAPAIKRAGHTERAISHPVGERKKTRPSRRQPREWLIEAKTGLSRQEIEEFLPLIKPSCYGKLARNLLSGASTETICEVMRLSSIQRFRVNRSMTAQALRRVKAELEAMSQDGHPFRQTLEEETGLSRERILEYLCYLPEIPRQFATLFLSGRNAREIALAISCPPRMLMVKKEGIVRALKRVAKNPKRFERLAEFRRFAKHQRWDTQSLKAKTRLTRLEITQHLPKLRPRHRELANLMLDGKPQEKIRQIMGYDEHRLASARYELARALKNLAAGNEPYYWLKAEPQSLTQTAALAAA